MIASKSNEQIKHIMKLQKSAKARKEQGLFVIEGMKLFEEARELKIIKKTYISESFYYKEVEHLELEGGTYEILSDSLMKEVSDTMTPQGILALAEKPVYHLEQFFSHKKGSLLFLEDVRDPGNVGTIIRTAEGAGIKGIILSKESVDVYNAKVIRSTMGSLFRMPLVYVEDFHKVLLQAKEKGFLLYAADLQGKNDYNKEKYAAKNGIIIGNEASGISEQTRIDADCLIKIPMHGKLESLNASIAAALMMYEVLRQ